MLTDFNLCGYLGRDKKHLFQKVLDITKANPAKLKFPMWASEKFDGVFCAALRKPDGSVGIFSRTGEEYLSLEHLKPFFGFTLRRMKDAEGVDKIILFEAYNPSADQATTSGACRDTKSQHPEILGYVYMAINSTRYGMRLYDEGNPIGASIIENETFLFGCGMEGCSSIRFVSHVRVESIEEAYELAESVWARGGEGIVLNAMDVSYQPGKRNETMVKIKKILTYDLEVTDVYEGRGKYAGTLGGLVCRWKDGKTIKVSGMTDEDRKKWWENPSEIIGKIVEVHAMTESSKGLLREPRYKGIRYDKMEADV